MADNILEIDRITRIIQTGTYLQLEYDGAIVLNIDKSTGDVTLGNTPGTGTINLYAALVTAAFGVSATSLTITGTTGYVQLPVLTTTQRDALTPANGMLVYNSTDGKFQGYQAGVWANLI